MLASWYAGDFLILKETAMLTHCKIQSTLSCAGTVHPMAGSFIHDFFVKDRYVTVTMLVKQIDTHSLTQNLNLWLQLV